MNPNQINSEILEALGVTEKNVCAAYLELAVGRPPKLTLQTFLLDGFKTKFSEYQLVPKEADDGK